MPLLCMLADLRQSAVKASHPRIVSTFEVQIYGAFTTWTIILYIFNFSVTGGRIAGKIRYTLCGTTHGGGRFPGQVCSPAGAGETG